MIFSLRGKHIYSDHLLAVVECGGVGYKCLSTAATLAYLPPIGEEVFLFTHMNVREDNIDIFAFSTMAELESFKMLISVSGVGPKVALAILSGTDPDSFAMSIAAGDVKALTAAPGVGPKLAQRIILELKDKITSDSLIEGMGSRSTVGAAAPKSSAGEAVSALVALGYSQTEAASAVSKLDSKLSVEDMIKNALKAFAMRG